MYMKYVFLVAMSVLLMDSAFAQDDYYRRKAESYTREAEYYQKKAAQYLRWAAEALSKH